MKQIFLTVLLVLCVFVFSDPTSAQIPLAVPEIEYPNDLKEMRALRRVFVHSTDPVLRAAMVKELSRERGLLDIVERPEEAEFYLVFHSLSGEGSDPLAASAGAGATRTAGTLVAFRLVETCDGFRPRLLFISRKSRVVQPGIVLPLTSFNQGGLSFNQGGLSPLNQTGPGPRSFSKNGLITEAAVRGGLFLIGKLFPGAFRFDQSNNTLFVKTSRQPEVQATREFVQEVKRAREQHRPSPATLSLGLDRFDNFATDSEPPPSFLKQSEALVPCNPKATQSTGVKSSSAYSGDGFAGSDALPAPRPATRARRVGSTNSVSPQ